MANANRHQIKSSKCYKVGLGLNTSKYKTSLQRDQSTQENTLYWDDHQRLEEVMSTWKGMAEVEM